MPIVGEHPERGVRLVLEREPEGPPWCYAGDAFTAASHWKIRAIVEKGGAVAITMGERVFRDGVGDGECASEMSEAEIAEKARLIVRTAAKHAQDERTRENEVSGPVRNEGAPPRRIQRWRGEK